MMLVHKVKIGAPAPKILDAPHRTLFVGCGTKDLKYRDMLVHFRHRWEFYIRGTLGFTTCDPGPGTQWHGTAERKIRDAHGVFILVSEHTAADPHARWQIEKALDLGVPMAGVDIRNRFEGEIPEGLNQRMTRYGWEWFAEFINGL